MPLSLWFGLKYDLLNVNLQELNKKQAIATDQEVGFFHSG